MLREGVHAARHRASTDISEHGGWRAYRGSTAS